MIFPPAAAAVPFMPGARSKVVESSFTAMPALVAGMRVFLAEIQKAKLQQAKRRWPGQARS
jgi:hypothetical protein